MKIIRVSRTQNSNYGSNPGASYTTVHVVPECEDDAIAVSDHALFPGAMTYHKGLQQWVATARRVDTACDEDGTPVGTDLTLAGLLWPDLFLAGEGDSLAVPDTVVAASRQHLASWRGGRCLARVEYAADFAWRDYGGPNQRWEIDEFRRCLFDLSSCRETTPEAITAWRETVGV